MDKNRELFLKAEDLIPGGVNSPVRACKAVGSYPLFLTHGKGAYVWDSNKDRYIDYVCSWGPLILGHSHPRVVSAIQEQAQRALTFGAPTELEIGMAQAIVELMPSIEMVRMVNSGTEATMSALRLARAYTKREKVVKFNGCYHGHVDSLLVEAGSGVATFGIPGCPGVPDSFAGTTISLPYNDLSKVESLFRDQGDQIAAVIVEPIAGNMGVVLPERGFLEGLRELTRRYDSLLIFDEVITGFRVGIGGAQGFFEIDPDITCLGKIIGGGLPVGAYGGRREIMGLVSPKGDVYQAGTLSGNPLAMAAGLETIKILREEDPYPRLASISKALFEGIGELGEKLGIQITVNYHGSMGTVFFGPGPIRSYEEAKGADPVLFGRFYREMRKRGIYLPPSQFEAWFLSTAHGPEEVDFTLKAAVESFERILKEER
ncbi:MAG: glutamate-1-semialdehyde 2,1-aminomutase [Desulfatiglandales bacterium]